MASFSQCSSAQQLQLQQKAPTTFNESDAYYQKWVAGVKGGGAGINLFIPISAESTLVLDSAYFRGRALKLEKSELEGKPVYIGRFLTDENKQPHDIVMHEDPKKEVGNQPPMIPHKIPFELQKNECVISYLEDGKTKYYKIDQVKEKTMLSYPMAPPPGGDGIKQKQ